MAYKQLATLAYNLYKKTADGKVDWEETVLKDVYQSSLANYSVRISLEESESIIPNDVRITIINSEGSVVESFSDVDLNDSWLSEFNIDGGAYRMMHSTYEIARRTALGSEKAVADILRELDDDIPF